MVMRTSVQAEGRVCPACGAQIWPTLEALELQGAATIDEIAYFTTMELALRLEQAIIRHYETYHPRRLRLFRRTGWKRLLR